MLPTGRAAEISADLAAEKARAGRAIEVFAAWPGGSTRWRPSAPGRGGGGWRVESLTGRRPKMRVRKRIWTNRDGSQSEAWIAAYTDQDGKRRMKSFKHRRAANAFHASVVPDLEKALVTSPPNPGDELQWVVHELAGLRDDMDKLVRAVESLDRVVGRLAARSEWR